MEVQTIDLIIQLYFLSIVTARTLLQWSLAANTIRQLSCFYNYVFMRNQATYRFSHCCIVL